MVEKAIEGFHLIFKGRVQGVGFRATTRHHALAMGLAGTVKNLADGAVEVYLQASLEQVEEFVERLQGDGGMGEVEQVVVEPVSLFKKESGFRILF